MGDGIVVVVGLSLAAAIIVLNMLVSLGRRATFRRELAAVRAGKYPAWQGYMRYRNPVNRQGYVARFLAVLLLAIVVFSFLPQSTQDNNAFFEALLVRPNLVVLVLSYVLGSSIALIMSIGITAITADAPAYRLLRGGTLQARELITRRLKMFVPARLPLLLVLGLCALLYGFGMSWEICVALLGIGYAATQIVAIWTLSRLQRWYYPCLPLEQSQWSALASRVEAWARAAGQPAPRVYVRSGPVDGFGNSAALGGSPGTLYLSDEFLANSEWRQQDALLCWLIVARAPLMRQTMRIITIRVGVPLALGGILVANLLLFTNSTIDVSQSALETLLSILLVIGILVLFSIMARIINRRARRIFSECDRRAVELTGDPWAAMTMLATMDTLCQGTPALGGRALGSVPPRLAELDALTRTPGPRAPWAYQPVPSLQPVLTGPYPITESLASQTQPAAATPAS
ncbi:MAG TPA: hypothetical protein VKQ30_13155 [Ktedonobacterales bacterium]|nr:hypothetical protein [Ktedonobacterales bacterium]